MRQASTWRKMKEKRIDGEEHAPELELHQAIGDKQGKNERKERRTCDPRREHTC
jgi:hypothetical protein